MKKPNSRRKRSSFSYSSPSAATGSDKGQEQQQQHHDERVDDLKKENEALKSEIKELQRKLANVSPNSDDGLSKLKEDEDSQKLRVLHDQVMELKKKLNCLSQLSARKQHSSQKQKSGVTGASPQDEIHRLKVQKVQLICKNKLESVQFRLSKASLGKEVLQLKKEQRRKDYEIRKLLALSEKQKLVLQRKTEEASVATKRLKELLESRKASSQRNSDSQCGKNPGVQGIEIELKIAARVEEIRADYEREMEEMADELRKFEEEAEMLRQENFSYLLQDKKEACKVRDSELKDLKEEIVRLSNLVNQLVMPNADIHRKKLDVDPVKPSVSGVSSIEFTDMSESECSGGNNAALGKYAPKVCCSCSKKSLCKTSKCECRAVGGSCGTGCGCTASKCTNRAVLLIQVDDSLKQKASQDSLQSSGNSETVVVSQPPDLDRDGVPSRKPLQQIGNTLVNSSPSATKPRKKMRGQKPVVQFDIVEQENAEGMKKAEAIALVDNQMRLTRAKRSQISK